MTPTLGCENYDRKLRELADDEQREEEALATQDALETEFVALMKKGDANAAADFAPRVPDWEKQRALRAAGLVKFGQVPADKRAARLYEVFIEALDYKTPPNAPSTSEMVQLVFNAAFGAVPLEQVRAQAKSLCERAAFAYAWANSTD